jgi:hypothetical protein
VEVSRVVEDEYIATAFEDLAKGTFKLTVYVIIISVAVLNRKLLLQTVV